MTALSIKSSMLRKASENRSQSMNVSANSLPELVSVPRIVGSDTVTTTGGLKGLFNMLSQFVSVGGDFV